MVFVAIRGNRQYNIKWVSTQQASDPYLLAGETEAYKITASVGSCGQIIGADLDIDRMMSEADRKMYADKETRRMTRED